MFDMMEIQPFLTTSHVQLTRCSHLLIMDDWLQNYEVVKMENDDDVNLGVMPGMHSTPLGGDEITHGMVLFQFLMGGYAEPGARIVIRNGSDMALLVRALRTPEGDRLFSRRFEEHRPPNSGPVLFERRIPVGVSGWDAEGIRLGRMVLRWSRQRLATEAGTAQLTILNIETGRSGGRPETLAALRAAMEAAGVVFGPDFVEWVPPGDGQTAADTVPDWP